MLSAGQVELLWDEVLPVEARELPEGLAGLGRVLADPVLLRPIAEAWEVSARGGFHARPSRTRMRARGGPPVSASEEAPPDVCFAAPREEPTWRFLALVE